MRFLSPNKSAPSTFVSLIAIAWLLQSAGRLAFAFYGTPGAMGKFLDIPVSDSISYVLFFMFLFLGLIGILNMALIVQRQTWGFKLILTGCLVSLGFDAWGCTLQITAVIGMVVPAATLLYLWHAKVTKRLGRSASIYVEG